MPRESMSNPMRRRVFSGAALLTPSLATFQTQRSSRMKSTLQIAAMALLLGCLNAGAQTVIFDQNFSGGYTGSFGTNAYGGGSPSSISITEPTSGGNPNGC